MSNTPDNDDWGVAGERVGGYCFTCQNLGTIECECGGDLCICGIGDALPCPRCHPLDHEIVRQSVEEPTE